MGKRGGREGEKTREKCLFDLRGLKRGGEKLRRRKGKKKKSISKEEGKVCRKASRKGSRKEIAWENFVKGEGRNGPF